MIVFHLVLLLHHRIHANDDNFMQFNSRIPLMDIYPLSALNAELFLTFNNPSNEPFLCHPEEEEFRFQNRKSSNHRKMHVRLYCWLPQEHDRRRRQLSSSCCNIWDMDTLTGHPSIHPSTSPPIPFDRCCLAEELSIRRIDSSSSRSSASIDNERGEQVLSLRPTIYPRAEQFKRGDRSSQQNGVVAWISGAIGI